MKNKEINYYKDVRKLLDSRDITTEDIQITQMTKSSSIGENKVAQVERKKSKQIKSDIVSSTIILGVVVGMLGVLTGSKAIHDANVQAEINDIKTVIQQQNPNISDEQLNIAAKDTYDVLNSYINTEDETAEVQIYYAYLHGKTNADMVLEGAYEISNNEDNYSFVPEDGYQVEIKATNMDDYISISFPGLEQNDKYEAYENRMKEIIRMKNSEAFENAKSSKSM